MGAQNFLHTVSQALFFRSRAVRKVKVKEDVRFAQSVKYISPNRVAQKFLKAILGAVFLKVESYLMNISHLSKSMQVS